MRELSKHDHLQAVRLERTGRSQTGFEHSEEVTSFANGLRNSAIRLKSILGDDQVKEEVRKQAAEQLSRVSRLLDELKAALR